MYSEEPVDPNDVDMFRYVDKNIKLFVKQTVANSNPRSWKRPKLSELSEFTWNDVVDPHKVTSEEADISESTFRFVDHDEYTRKVTVVRLKNASSGLYVIRDLLPDESQLYWARKALCEYSLEDHTNLSNLHKDASEVVPWSAAVTGKSFQEFLKLRWSCLGYHYDWTARKYQRNLKSAFPSDFAHLCREIAKVVDRDFEPEAAIVNYYPLSSSMGGHLDDAEHTLEKPIVSLSLGCSAIFLLGGTRKTTKPVPILVRSGDVVIMTDESRRCYHGVPCILPPSFSHLVDQNRELGLSKPSSLLHVGSPEYNHLPLCDRRVVDFLNEARLNMNVRQVRVNARDAGDDSWLEKAGTGCVKLQAVNR